MWSLLSLQKTSAYATASGVDSLPNMAKASITFSRKRGGEGPVVTASQCGYWSKIMNEEEQRDKRRMGCGTSPNNGGKERACSNWK